MHHDAGTIALLAAIENGNVQKFEQLTHYITNPEQYRSNESLRLMLRLHAINTDQITECSTTIKKATADHANTVCNLSFYKNLGLGLSCFATAATVGGLFLWIHVCHGEFDFLKNGVAMMGAISILSRMGAKHIRIAYKNEDAHNEYPKQLAIQLLLQKIHNKARERV